MTLFECSCVSKLTCCLVEKVVHVLLVMLVQCLSTHLLTRPIDKSDIFYADIACLANKLPLK